jgi:hypothetical protein
MFIQSDSHVLVMFLFYLKIGGMEFFIVQLMHTNYIKMWIIKTFKIIAVVSTCEPQTVLS